MKGKVEGKKKWEAKNIELNWMKSHETETWIAKGLAWGRGNQNSGRDTVN
jgi:hypothetical protein